MWLGMRHVLYIFLLVLMTYHQLKRTNIIMNYVENARVLQGTVDLCKVPHAIYITVYYSILQYTTVYYSILQYITVYCSILQYTTVYHSILQYIKVPHVPC